MINIKILDSNKIKLDEKSHKTFVIYYIGYVTFKDLRYVEIYIVNLLYLIINKINEYFEEISGNKYWTLFPTNESKNTLKKYEELWNKLRDIIRLKANNSDNYDEKYM